MGKELIAYFSATGTIAQKHSSAGLFMRPVSHSAIAVTAKRKTCGASFCLRAYNKGHLFMDDDCI